MTECKRQKLVLSGLGRRRVEADFSGGRLTSDAGLLLLREVDRKLGLLDRVQAAIPDPRNPVAITHEQRELLAQRVFALAAKLQPTMEQAAAAFQATDQKQRLFAEFSSAARSWDRPRRVIGKAEYGPKEANPRFVVTNLPDGFAPRGT